MLLGKSIEDLGYVAQRIKTGSPEDLTLRAIEGTIEDQGIGLTLDEVVHLLLAFYVGIDEDLRDRINAMIAVLVTDLGWREAKAERFAEGVWERVQEGLSKRYDTKLPISSE